ncbi:hypothetical protein KUCAC02_030363 [Chaenocephalus aceratus]|uniref:Uncharacterized protein n=1 Tax=Chaenocephalus aceratus TaxID=36190 RepID=A0ACB9XKQ7_CHAAC|nr:hypothetical protein KUCAC02_030363 [Chaenocephalus aceratus]
MNISSLNSTSPSSLSFAEAVYKNVIVTVLCITINYINGTLIHTFRKHQVCVCVCVCVSVCVCSYVYSQCIFYSNPRYILFIHLLMNDMLQLTLSTLLHIISYTLNTFSVSSCLLILAVMATFNTPLNLAGMAVECYVAICLPLHHCRICTVRNTFILMSLIWFVSSLSIMPDFFLLLATEPLCFFTSKVLCARDFVFRSSYSLKKRDASHIVCLVLVWLTLLYTYFRILFAAKGAKGDLKKARNTILLHGFQLLLCMLTYVRPMFKDALVFLLPQRHADIRFSLYVFVQIIPRFVSPIVYGLRDQNFRKYMRRYLLCRVIMKKKPPGEQRCVGHEACSLEENTFIPGDKTIVSLVLCLFVMRKNHLGNNAVSDMKPAVS